MSADGNISPLSLAYLAEVAIVVNFAYGEIRYSKTKVAITRSLEDVYKEFSLSQGLLEEQIEIKKDIFPEYYELKALVESEDKDKGEWQNHRVLRTYYRCLKSGKTHIMVWLLIIFCIVGLCVSTYYCNLQFINPWIESSVLGWVWFLGYLFYVLFIAIPLVLLLCENRCSRYLLGNGGKEKGRINELKDKLIVRRKALSKDLEKQAGEFKAAKVPL